MAKSARNKQQTTLAFSPLPPSDPARAQQPEAIRSRAAAVTLSMSPSPMRKTRSHTTLITPRKSSQSELVGSSPLTHKSRSSFMGTSNITTTPKHQKARKRSTLAIPEDSESDSDVDEVSTGKRRQVPSLKRPIVLDESDSDEIVVRANKISKVTTATPSKRRTMATYQLSNDSDSEDPITSRSRRVTSSQQTGANSSRRAMPQLISSEDEAANDGESEEVNDDDSDALPVSRGRAKQRHDGSPGRSQNLGQDQADLAEDIDFFKSSDTPSTTRRTATTKQSAKQAALEALKRKRLQRSAKTNIGTPQQPVSLDESDAEEESAEDVEEEGDIYNEDLDQDEEDFVVDDHDDEIGAPVELPFQFSRFQSMKAEELFKYAVEWMVQKKINPAFAMKDEIYVISFQRLDDFVKGLGGSKFQSAAWTSTFLKSLLARPILEDHRFINSGFEHNRCDACNRSGHPATWEIRFRGPLYDKTSLEEDSDHDETDQDESGDDASPTFYVGKFCMQNARTAHTLAHWRYHLNEWVIDYLREKGYLISKKIVERDGWTSKKRRKYANRVADEMENEGEIKRLHRDFRNEIKTAQLANDNY